MIEFNKPYYDEAEIEHIKLAMFDEVDYKSRSIEPLNRTFGVGKQIFLTCNATMAAEAYFLAMNFSKGSEVILPSFNYPSIANIIIKYNLVPVFVDISKKTLVVDLVDVERKITAKTCLIVVVNYGGASCDFDVLKDIAGKIPIFEDAALSFGGKYKGRPLGTIGDCGIVSFHKTKNLSCDVGGMLILNNKLENMDYIYENGTNRLDFLQGKADRYSWVTMGSNVAMANINAAILYAQLQKQDAIYNLRKDVYFVYLKELSSLKDRIRLPDVPQYNVNNFHVFYIIFYNQTERDYLDRYLKNNKIGVATHYSPLHLSKMGKKYSDGSLKNTEYIDKTMLRLPIHAHMKKSDAHFVIEKVREAFYQYDHE